MPVVIGPRLRAARQELGFSMAIVAEALGVTKGFISRLERDDVSPSVQTLVRLCEVLSISVGELLEKQVQDGFVAWEDAKIMDGDGAIQRELTPVAESSVSLLRVHVRPGWTSGERLYTVSSDAEVVHVLDGRIRLEFSTQSHELCAGDTYTMEGLEPHRWENASETETAEVIWILTPAPNANRRRRGRTK